MEIYQKQNLHDWQSTNPQYIWNNSTITICRKSLMTKSTHSSISKLAKNSAVAIILEIYNIIKQLNVKESSISCRIHGFLFFVRKSTVLGQSSCWKNNFDSMMYWT